MRVGLYFGTFNPIHMGHLIIGNITRQFAGLDEVWFVVTPKSPFKKNQTLLNENDRYHLVTIAIQKEPKLKASNIEFKLPKPNYTIDTLTYLQEKYPKHTFSIIMGSDGFQNIEKWKNYKQIIDNYQIWLYKRPGYPIDYDSGAKHLTVVDAPLLNISASYIREKIKTNWDIEYLVTDEVKAEIEKNNYYK